MMRNTKKTSTHAKLLLGIGVALAALAGAAGCASPKASSKESFFLSENERSVNNFVNAQVANGAREDATLEACHFDGTAVNSLGAQKLAMLVPDGAADQDIVVWVNLPADDASTPARRAAVSAWLEQECGIQGSHIKLESGNNPASSSPAAEGIARLDKTESKSAAADSGQSPAMMTK